MSRKPKSTAADSQLGQFQEKIECDVCGYETTDEKDFVNHDCEEEATTDDREG